MRMNYGEEEQNYTVDTSTVDTGVDFEEDVLEGLNEASVGAKLEEDIYNTAVEDAVDTEDEEYSSFFSFGGESSEGGISDYMPSMGAVGTVGFLLFFASCSINSGHGPVGDGRETFGDMLRGQHYFHQSQGRFNGGQYN